MHQRDGRLRSSDPEGGYPGLVKWYLPLAALWLALSPVSAVGQIRGAAISAAAEGSSAVGASANAISNVGVMPLTSLTFPSGAPLSLSVAPAPALAGAQLPVGLTPAAVAAQILSLPLGQAPLSNPSGKVAQSVAVKSVAIKSVAVQFVISNKAASAALTAVRDEVANWSARAPGDLPAAQFSHPAPALSPRLSAPSIPSPRETPPAPPSRSPPDRSRPRLSKSLLISGAVLIGVSLTSVYLPALLPAAFIAWQGSVAVAGFGALAASRFWRSPGSAPDVPRGPPAPSKGAFSSFKSAWAAARDSAAAQASFESRVGGSSWTSIRDWLFGGFRTGVYWMAPSLMLMLAGAVAAKTGIFAFGLGAWSFAADSAIAGPSLTGFIPMALAAQAAGVALFFGVEALARKLGLGRGSAWLGGAAAFALAGGALLAVTHEPFIIAASLGLEAGVLWSAARSRSFLVPLALRGLLTLFSLEAARLAGWLSLDTTATLAGLPAVWGGVAVAGLVALAWKLKAPGLRLAEIGAWWKADAPGQTPMSPGRILSAGMVWGLVVYAIGDLVFWGVNALVPGQEPTPAILVKMLTGSVDLVLYNFIIVGLLEEYVFRRGLFKMMNEKLEKWGLPLQKAFWVAAIGSALIFSGVHYVDWGAILAKIGMGDPAASSGLGGSYAFSAAGFAARSVLGVVLAWIYKRSGLLLIPIVAHFWADSMEGLGLRWGLPAFLALAAGALLASFLFRAKTASPKG